MGVGERHTEALHTSPPHRTTHPQNTQGAYRDAAGQPVVLDVVRAAEKRITGTNEMEYLPIGGLQSAITGALQLAYGANAPVLQEQRVAALQTLSGTGACRLFAEAVARFFPGAVAYLPNPTWANHHNIFRDAHVPVRQYSYYNPATRGLDFEGMMHDLSKAPEGSVVLLHACAHNPTGVDPTPSQWAELSTLMRTRNLFPMFDSAYQGFASGCFDKDAWALRRFVADGHCVALAQSFAKNLGLYGQRVGVLSVVTGSSEEAAALDAQLRAIARPMYSSPPLHGALLLSTVLNDPQLCNDWSVEVAGMANRIKDMRSLLRMHLESTCNSPFDWQHITSQIGMFCYTGMTPEQVDVLTGRYSVYLTRNGRISMAGVTPDNVEQLAHAMHEVTSGGR